VSASVVSFSCGRGRGVDVLRTESSSYSIAEERGSLPVLKYGRRASLRHQEKKEEERCVRKEISALISVLTPEKGVGVRRAVNEKKKRKDRGIVRRNASDLHRGRKKTVIGEMKKPEWLSFLASCAFSYLEGSRVTIKREKITDRGENPSSVKNLFRALNPYQGGNSSASLMIKDN